MIAGRGRGQPLAALTDRPTAVQVASLSFRALATSPFTEPRGLAVRRALAAVRDRCRRTQVRARHPARARRLADADRDRHVPARTLDRADAPPPLRRRQRARERPPRASASRSAGATSSPTSRAPSTTWRRSSSSGSSSSRPSGRASGTRQLGFGEALVATHDSTQLLQVIVETAVEATGADGGLVLGREGELVRIGDPEAPGERIAFPLRAGASDFGSLVITAPTFDADQVEAAASLAAQAVVALENARLHRIVERQALFDSLTGLANRRRLEETMRAELARARTLPRSGLRRDRRPRRLQARQRHVRPRRRRRGAEGVRACAQVDRARERCRRTLGRGGVRARADRHRHRRRRPARRARAGGDRVA